MLKVEIEGVYESDIGTGQKKYVDFNYTFKTARLTERGIHTHIEKRFIPMLIASDKSKKAMFSGLRNFNILNIEPIENDEDCIIGKEIDKLNAWELQDLACTFDLYDVPLNGKYPLNTIREKAISAYIKKILNFNVDDPKEKAKLDCVVKNADGTLSYDFTNNKIIVQVPEGYLQKAKKEEPKVKVAELMKQANQVNADGTFSEVLENVHQENEQAGGENPDNGNGFPSANVLTNIGNLFKPNPEA